MSTNLISSIMQFVTPDLIAKIASAVGIDRNVAQKAIAAGAPAILAALASLASKPGGAQQLSSALTQLKQTMPDTLVNSIGGSGQSAVAEEGADLLSTLLGSSGLNSLTSAMGAYTGISQGKSATLLGFLAPLVMGAVGQYQRKTGPSSAGLAELLTSQKSQIASALPADFVDDLNDSGFMDTLDRSLRSSAEAASTASRRVGGMAEDSMRTASRAATATSQRMPTWPYWLAGLAIVAGLGWYVLREQEGARLAEQTTPPAAPAGETVGRGTPNQMVADLSGQLTTSMGAMQTTLQDIRDSASAQAAMPKLQQMTAELEKINNAAAQLPPEARKMIAARVAPVMPAFNQLCEKVLAIPGVASIARPHIDSMRQTLDTMSRA